MEATPREMLLCEIHEHEREITRLSSEIWWLDEVESCWARPGMVHARLRREVEYATAQLTRRRIRLALLASRLGREEASQA